MSYFLYACEYCVLLSIFILLTEMRQKLSKGKTYKDGLGGLQRRALNDLLVLVGRGFLEEQGLKSRRWFKRVVSTYYCYDRLCHSICELDFILFQHGGLLMIYNILGNYLA